MKHANTRGFHLLEVLLVLAIITLLILFAYPRYAAYMIQSRRIDAQVAILELANKMNEYYGQHHSYEHATLLQLDMSEYSPDHHYRLHIIEANANSYQIEAIPVGAQIKDKQCGHYLYNQAGDKGITGEGKVDACW